MTTTGRIHRAHDVAKVRNRAAAARLFAIALPVTVGWTGEAWGQAKMARVGILVGDTNLTSDYGRQAWEPFRRTLAHRGWIEGKNVSFEIRGPSGDPPQFADAAAEVVRLKVDVIWAANAPAVRAAYAATRTIPIVAQDFTTDPVEAGYAESYARPGGNLTGVFLDAPELAGKWVELLRTMIPGITTVAVVWDPSPGDAHLRAVQNAAASFGIQLQIIEVRKATDIERAVASIRGRPRALIILPSPMLYYESDRLARLALKNRLLATSMFNLFAEAGGTLVYGHDKILTTESCAVLVARILGGAHPGELPVERPTKFNLIVNLKSAKALGLTIPQSILLRADEVIR